VVLLLLLLRGHAGLGSAVAGEIDSLVVAASHIGLLLIMGGTIHIENRRGG
jgi:hypothetical protein